MDGHLGYFYILAIVISSAMNIGMHVSFQLEFVCVCVCVSGYMPRSGVV